MKENFFVDVPPFGERRNVYVYLPECYKEKGEPLPVIYFCDGQNAFDEETSSFGMSWHADTALDKIFALHGKTAVVVGVECSPSKRNTEYSPWKTDLYELAPDYFGSDLGGCGDEYARFVAQDLTKIISQRYNVSTDRCKTAIVGSSMGGLISCYIGLRYPHVFGCMGLFSSAVCFNRGELESFLDEVGANALPEQKAFVYCGGKEDVDGIPARGMLDDSVWLYNRLAEMGVTAKLVLDSDKFHNELAWCEHFPSFAEYFLDINR